MPFLFYKIRMRVLIIRKDFNYYKIIAKITTS